MATEPSWATDSGESKRTTHGATGYGFAAGDVLLAYLDYQVRQSGHELFVKLAHSVSSVIMFVPRLVVVTRRVAEGRDNALQVMLVLQPDVLLNGCDASRLFLIGSSCVCQRAPPIALWHVRKRFANHLSGERRPGLPGISLTGFSRVLSICKVYLPPFQGFTKKLSLEGQVGALTYGRKRDAADGL